MAAFFNNKRNENDGINNDAFGSDSDEEIVFENEKAVTQEENDDLHNTDSDSSMKEDNDNNYMAFNNDEDGDDRNTTDPKINLEMYLSDTSSNKDDIDMNSPPRIERNLNQIEDLNAATDHQLLKSPFRKGTDNKDDYSINTSKEPAQTKKTRTSFISPDANKEPIESRSSSRLRKKTPDSTGNGGGLAL